MSASAGRVLILPKGDYDNTVEYKMLDMVTYQNGSYLCKQTTTGNLPTDTTYWQEMITTPDMTGASAGAAGTHGLVPAPSAGDQAKYLRGDATWAAIDLSSKADQSIIGGSYSASTAYEPGDRFSYNGVRYKVIIESGTVSGQTPPNANYYEVCSVDDDIMSLNNSLIEYVDITKTIIYGGAESPWYYGYVQANQISYTDLGIPANSIIVNVISLGSRLSGEMVIPITLFDHTPYKYTFTFESPRTFSNLTRPFRVFYYKP